MAQTILDFLPCHGLATFANMFTYLEKGNFSSEGEAGYWWSASESGRGSGIYKHIYNYIESVNRQLNDKKSLLSIRCIQDTPAPPKGEAK